MMVTRRIAACIVCLLLCVPAALAQSYALNGEAYGVLVDADGTELVPPGKYGSIYALSETGTLFGAQSLTEAETNVFDGETYANPLMHILDEKGNPVTSRLYENMQHYPELGIVVVERGGLYGALDETGKELIPCSFKGLSPNGEGGYLSNTAELYSGKPGDILLVDEQGKATKTGARAMNTIWRFVDGLALASQRYGKDGLLATDGTWALPAKYEAVTPFVGPYAIVKQNGKYGLLDRDFQWALKPRYKELAQDKDPAYPILALEGGGRVTLLDRETLKPLAQFREPGVFGAYFEGGYAILATDKGSVVYSLAGERLLKMPEYGYVSTTGADETGVFCASFGSWEVPDTYLIDPRGEKIAGPFSNLWYLGPCGKAHYYQCGRSDDLHLFSGAIDEKGTQRLDMVYDSLYQLGDDRFYAACGSRWGMIDGAGKWLAQYSIYEELMD